MADLAYTDADHLRLLIGQLGLDLRTDDDAETDLIDEAISFASGEIDFYCSKYSATELQSNRWVTKCATWLAARWLCLHRLNDVPKSLLTQCESVEKKLELILQGKAPVPRAALSRRPITVTNTHVDLRRPNGQVRVDRTRSTGVAQDYVRPTDPTAPDQR